MTRKAGKKREMFDWFYSISNKDIQPNGTIVVEHAYPWPMTLKEPCDGRYATVLRSKTVYHHG